MAGEALLHHRRRSSAKAISPPAAMCGPVRTARRSRRRAKSDVDIVKGRSGSMDSEETKLMMKAFPRALLAAVAGLVALSLLTVGVDAARAGSPVVRFEVTPKNAQATQAGGHPDILTVVHVKNTSTQELPSPGCQCSDPKTVTIHIPTGVIGDPHATPQCTAADFGGDHCPSDSQVGVTSAGFLDSSPASGGLSNPIGV